MKWSINQLKEQASKFIPFEDEPDIASELHERIPTLIRLHAVKTQGYIQYEAGEVLLQGEIQARLELPSTRTLEPVVIDLPIKINERYVSESASAILDEEEVTVMELSDDTIDLNQVIVDLITINIPMKIYDEADQDDALPSGNDWVVMTEERYLKQQQTQREEQGDPRFAKLKQLFDEADQ